MLPFEKDKLRAFVLIKLHEIDKSETLELEKFCERFKFTLGIRKLNYKIGKFIEILYVSNPKRLLRRTSRAYQEM